MRRGSVRETIPGVAVATVVTLSAALLGGCSPAPRSPGATLSAFLAAWASGDSRAMGADVDGPPAAPSAALSAITDGLHATAVHRVASPPVVHGARATSTITSTYALPGVGSWRLVTSATLTRRSGSWRVEWSPALAAPGLTGGERLDFSPRWAARAPIEGAGGMALTTEQDHVVVGVEGSRVKDPSALTQLMTAAGAPAATVASALAAASSHPTFFEPVLQLTAPAYQALGGSASALYRAPGTVFRHVNARGAVTPGLSTHLVGSVGPITAEQLKQLGPPYRATDSVGQSGLEAYYEKQLAGTPGGVVTVDSAAGQVVTTLATFAPVAGRPVTTSIDPGVQRAAEQALAPVTGTAGLVALRVSTGEVLASVSLPAATPFDAALDGAYPPGSTFKIVTVTALLHAGLSPTSGATCPPTATIDGEVFHNAEGDRPVSDLAAAFTESCNTAFVQLAAAHLHPSDLTSAAALYGLGSPLRMGYPAFPGRVPTPADGASLAATSIGQAGLEVSPLDMAVVAADVARGAARTPRLVAGAPADTAGATPLDPAVVTALRTMMASVVASGTAAGTGLPPGTYAKTGTAQYGTGNPLPTDAWLVGWHGDVAFAMVVQDSKGNGGPVDGPVVARFLAALPAAGG